MTVSQTRTYYVCRDRNALQTERAVGAIMSNIALSFSYDGYHRKSSGPIDSIKHLQMLLAAIDVANPNHEHAVIVSAIGFDIWAMPTEEERMLAWQVYQRARIVTVLHRAEDHQHGAAWAIRMATEAAAAIGAEYLVHLAEDILLAPDAIEYFVRELSDSDYVGTWWGNTNHESVNTQLFACRVSAMADLQLRRFVVDPANCSPHVEGMLWRRMREYELRIKVGEAYTYPGRSNDSLYFHSHDPEAFFAEYERRGFGQPQTTGCRLPALTQQYADVCNNGSDISQHCPTLFGLACQVNHITEFGTRQGNSTTAFLAAAPARLVCYDTEIKDEPRRLEALSEGRMQIHQQNVLEIEIEETDLLFIDTWHVYAQLAAELRLHSHKARRWIVMHDTTTFGEQGEGGGEGLWKAVDEFLTSNPNWRVKSRVHYNNGLTILERVA